MPRLQVQRNDRGCISSQKINLGKCDGGCGAYSDNCCKPTHKKEKIFLACPDQTFAPMEVSSNKLYLALFLLIKKSCGHVVPHFIPHA